MTLVRIPLYKMTLCSEPFGIQQHFDKNPLVYSDILVRIPWYSFVCPMISAKKVLVAHLLTNGGGEQLLKLKC